MPKYPFEPKSNASLEPGQYWAITLSDGRFACGRVLAVPGAADRETLPGTKNFLAGLMGWVGKERPTADAIAGSRLVNQGYAHVKTIRETGSALLGIRPLELDTVKPFAWRTDRGADAWVYQGTIRERPVTRDDSAMPTKTTWGFKFIKTLAEAIFVSGRLTQTQFVSIRPSDIRAR